MNRDELATQIRAAHREFATLIEGLSSQALCAAPPQKWTPAQQLQHLVLAVRPIVRALWLPKFLLRWMFGKANRPSRSYDELVAKYQSKIDGGGRASAAFVPPAVQAHECPRLLKELLGYAERFARQVAACSEAQLDSVVAPHPLLGKITLRELVYFTVYHVRLHGNLVRRDQAQMAEN